MSFINAQDYKISHTGQLNTGINRSKCSGRSRADPGPHDGRMATPRSELPTAAVEHQALLSHSVQ